MWHSSLRSQTRTHRARIWGYRDTGVEATALYCDCQVGVDPEDKLGGNKSLAGGRVVVAEPRTPDKGSCRLCADLPRNGLGPELDA